VTAATGRKVDGRVLDEKLMRRGAKQLADGSLREPRAIDQGAPAGRCAAWNGHDGATAVNAVDERS